ncbi:MULTISPECIES: (2Fe-2S)-binding protein [Halobaculum]|uniref:(2Fe-2S)-binding protein n=2 Tax=Halobaculum TaxID=43927 RepID=A0A8T8WHA1_9EURY|nr:MULTISPECIES: (2Fe-2S)-binding protein [Halobaculum]QZP39166.1 (2Fe-2S)-binding protein [Halobaculum magnesiiphilum]QZY04198.1 (2Fe-2S)-binding protein [Halobaculum roseum]
MTDDTPTTTVSVTINGEEYVRETEDRRLLVHFLREEVGLTGTHQGCVVGKCGACTVLHNGVPKKSCMLYAAAVDEDEITTVEGLAKRAEMNGVAMKTREGTTFHPLQMGFKQNHGLQCGFCTPGFLMTATALLRENPDPTREEIKSAISGNICRCTGYTSIVDSIEWAAARLREDEPAVADGGIDSTPCEGCNCEIADDVEGNDE